MYCRLPNRLHLLTCNPFLCTFPELAVLFSISRKTGMNIQVQKSVHFFEYFLNIWSFLSASCSSVCRRVWTSAINTKKYRRHEEAAGNAYGNVFFPLIDLRTRLQLELHQVTYARNSSKQKLWSLIAQWLHCKPFPHKQDLFESLADRTCSVWLLSFKAFFYELRFA